MDSETSDSSSDSPTDTETKRSQPFLTNEQMEAVIRGATALCAWPTEQAIEKHPSVMFQPRSEVVAIHYCSSVDPPVTLRRPRLPQPW